MARFDRYQVMWEDATSHCEWKSLEEAKSDTPAICFTEGYLIEKNNRYCTFVMSFNENDIGDQMIIPTSCIRTMKKVGTKTFSKKDFEYKDKARKTTPIKSSKNRVFNLSKKR